MFFLLDKTRNGLGVYFSNIDLGSNFASVSLFARNLAKAFPTNSIQQLRKITTLDLEKSDLVFFWERYPDFVFITYLYKYISNFVRFNIILLPK